MLASNTLRRCSRPALAPRWLWGERLPEIVALPAVASPLRHYLRHELCSLAHGSFPRDWYFAMGFYNLRNSTSPRWSGSKPLTQLTALYRL